MTYLMADAHGCYQEFLQLLETIGFSADDELFLLGDVVDRGPEPIPLLRHIIRDPRCSLLLGNHEAFMLAVLRSPLAAEITEESIAALALRSLPFPLAGRDDPARRKNTGRMRTSAPTSSSQASYPSSCRIRRDSLIPLLVLSPT